MGTKLKVCSNPKLLVFLDRGPRGRVLSNLSGLIYGVPTKKKGDLLMGLLNVYRCSNPCTEEGDLMESDNRSLYTPVSLY